MRLGDVEHDARRAGTRVERDLEVPDFGPESGGIERDSAARIFYARFIVPQRLVVVDLETAENRDVGRAAQRDVERVIDTAEAEALGRLQVYAEVAARLPRQDAARGKAARLGLVGAVIVVGEDSARVELAFFVEAIITTAAGDLELAEVIARLAEQGALANVVGKIRIVGRVEGKTVSHDRRNTAG